MIPVLAIAISFSFALGYIVAQDVESHKRMRRRHKLEERFRRDAEAYRFAAKHPSPTLAELHSRGITADDVRQALEDLNK